MTAEVTVSKELQDLIKAMLKKAYDEGVKTAELNELIIKEYKNVMPQEQVQKKYREVSEEEKEFQQRVYDFFSKEISREEYTCKEIRERGGIVNKEIYERDLLFFSEIMCAAKVLLNDGEKITIKKIRDVMYSNSQEKRSYGRMLAQIGYNIKKISEIAANTNKWKKYNILYWHKNSDIVLNTFLKILEDQ